MVETVLELAKIVKLPAAEAAIDLVVVVNLPVVEAVVDPAGADKLLEHLEASKNS